jgi:hypothetical protein
MTSYWTQNAMRPGLHTLVDIGPMSERRTRERYARLRQYLALLNFQIVGNGRLTVRLPLRKRDFILKRFRSIKEGAAGYCWCTHGFAEVKGSDAT